MHDASVFGSTCDDVGGRGTQCRTKAPERLHCAGTVCHRTATDCRLPGRWPVARMRTNGARRRRPRSRRVSAGVFAGPLVLDTLEEKEEACAPVPWWSLCSRP